MKIKMFIEKFIDRHRVLSETEYEDEEYYPYQDYLSDFEDQNKQYENDSSTIDVRIDSLSSYSPGAHGTSNNLLWNCYTELYEKYSEWKCIDHFVLESEYSKCVILIQLNGKRKFFSGEYDREDGGVIVEEIKV
jgi:hypothetical protein